MTAPLFSIPNIPIRNLGPVHPQARLGLGFASDTTILILLAVHLTHPRIGTLKNLPRHTLMRLSASSMTPSPTQSRNALVVRGVRCLLYMSVLSLPRTFLRACPTLGVGSSNSLTRRSFRLTLSTRLLLPSSHPLRTHSKRVWLRFNTHILAPLCHGLGPLFFNPRGLSA